MFFPKLSHKLNVTESHINDGIKDSPYRCPVAISLLEDGYDNVFITYQFIYIGNMKFVVNEEISKFMISYDRGNEVHPFKTKMKRKIF